MEQIPQGVLSLVAAVGSVIAMLAGMYFVFDRLKQKQQGFGANSIKALGLVLFIPTLVLISISRKEFQSETLAALLGTVAGYVLSRSKDEDT